jgi:2-aminoadipate transaminase
MKPTFADRINDVPRSFLREILKVAISDNIISFAGGLPNRSLFPVDAIRAAADMVLSTDASSALQYGSSEGYRPLREWIADRYRLRSGLEISADNVLITTGSQQGLDLLGKVLLNEGDTVAIEEPGYLGAIQAFSAYRARFGAVPLTSTGADADALANVMHTHQPKLFYTVPNFQNPSGISYDETCREAVARVIQPSNTVLVEDDPYHELRFRGQAGTSFAHLAAEHTVMLGSFSKIVAPSFRVGWLVADAPLLDKLLVAKQATDLHTSEITQRILHRYLLDNDVDAHIELIRDGYGARCRAMLDALHQHFPADCSFTEPQGGMFLWVTLGAGLSSMALFDHAIDAGVAFVPGIPFYTAVASTNTLRLNFSCADPDMIEVGIRRLADSVHALRESSTVEKATQSRASRSTGM